MCKMLCVCEIGRLAIYVDSNGPRLRKNWPRFKEQDPNFTRFHQVTIALSGDYGKPRPALVIESDLFAAHPSVTILPVTSASQYVFVQLSIVPYQTM